MKLFRCFLLLKQGSSLLQLRSLLISSWVKEVRFCPHDWADDANMTFLAAIGFEKNSNLTC